MFFASNTLLPDDVAYVRTVLSWIAQDPCNSQKLFEQLVPFVPAGIYTAPDDSEHAALSISYAPATLRIEVLSIPLIVTPGAACQHESIPLSVWLGFPGESNGRYRLKYLVSAHALQSLYFDMSARFYISMRH